MKNREKYREEIVKNATEINKGGCEFIKRNVLPTFGDGVSCSIIDCTWCRFLLGIWLDEEYIEPEVDWSKVPVDTLVRVRDREEQEWILRYFKGINEDSLRHRYEVWESGETSKTANGKYLCWKYCELVEEEENEE